MDFVFLLLSGEPLQKVCHFMHLLFLFFLAGVWGGVWGGVGFMVVRGRYFSSTVVPLCSRRVGWMEKWVENKGNCDARAGDKK